MPTRFRLRSRLAARVALVAGCALGLGLPAEAQHRARLSADLADHLQAGSQNVEVIVDGNLRRKEQKAFSSLFGFDTSDARELTTAAITPRAIIDTRIAGMPTKVIAGFDYYNSKLEAKRSVTLNDPPIHTYNLQQQSTAAYAQQTLAVLPTTDLSWGGRLEQMPMTGVHPWRPDPSRGLC